MSLAEAIIAPPVRRTCGAALICGQAAVASVLSDGVPCCAPEPAVYAELATLILRCTTLDVILHLPQRVTEGAATREAVERSVRPTDRARLHIIVDAPLADLLAGVELLVSFASPALIEGCRHGLRPVQIGRRLKGSERFSDTFPCVESFAAALAAGSLVGRMSLGEYEEFERFCRAVATSAAASPKGWRFALPFGARTHPRDPVVAACGAAFAPPRSLPQTIFAAIANPFAAWRLVRGNFG